MKEESVKTTMVTMRMPVDILERIDKIAGRVRLPRTQIMVNLIGMGLDDAETLDAKCKGGCGKAKK